MQATSQPEAHAPACVSAQDPAQVPHHDDPTPALEQGGIEVHIDQKKIMSKHQWACKEWHVAHPTADPGAHSTADPGAHSTADPGAACGSCHQ